jgi:hypothetical protein
MTAAKMDERADTSFLGTDSGRTGALAATGSTVYGKGCTFQGNKAPNSAPVSNGGAISAVNSRIDCTSCTFQDNSAAGCAVTSTPCCPFQDNSAAGRSVTSMPCCTFQDNSTAGRAVTSMPCWLYIRNSHWSVSCDFDALDHHVDVYRTPVSAYCYSHCFLVCDARLVLHPLVCSYNAYLYRSSHADWTKRSQVPQ